MEAVVWHWPEKVKNLRMQNVIKFTDDLIWLVEKGFVNRFYFGWWK
jgi:hypothetical protein